MTDQQPLTLGRDAWLIATGVPAGHGAVLRRHTETIASGHGARPTDTVEQIIGRPPRRFAGFAHAAAPAWAPEPAR